MKKIFYFSLPTQQAQIFLSICVTLGYVPIARIVGDKTSICISAPQEDLEELWDLYKQEWHRITG